MTSNDGLDEGFTGTATSVVTDEVIGGFIAANEALSRKLCVITSGGTQAALEKRMVRSLENFSSGLRGARMTEAILEITDDYGVILLVRKGAVLPYARTFSVANISDALSFQPTCEGVELKRCDEAKDAATRMHAAIIEETRLLVVEYVSVQEYILTLRHISIALVVSRAGRYSPMICLAAAVSDFYVPEAQLSRHKLQAEGGELVLRLCQVPKCLGLLRAKWAPQNTMIVSFKLETDEELLVPRSRTAISSYGVDLVVGNILETRYEKITLVDRHNTHDILLDPAAMKEGSRMAIENLLMERLVERHAKHMEQMK